MNLLIKGVLEAQGKYEDLLQVHEGACAYSFTAQQRHLNRPVFLKVYEYIEGDGINVFTEPQHFESLFRSGARCPNIVDLYDVEIIVVNGQKLVCCQMEFVDGASLYGHLLHNCIGQQDAVRITLGILKGLAHLHDRKIFHRDIKLANIMLNGLSPKITDLGSAAIVPEGKTYVKASRNSALYLPPEGFEDKPKYYHQSDIYQVGVVLYELINGPLEQDLSHYITPAGRRVLNSARRQLADLDGFEQTKFLNGNIRELASKAKLLEYGRAPRPYYSKALKRFIKKMTAPDFSQRFVDCATASAELSRINAPNWKMTSSEDFFLEQWKGHDYKVYVQRRPRSEKVIVEKSTAGRNNFQKMNKVKFATVADAIDYLNEA